MEPESSWILVGFVAAEPRRELLDSHFKDKTAKPCPGYVVKATIFQGISRRLCCGTQLLGQTLVLMSPRGCSVDGVTFPSVQENRLLSPMWAAHVQAAEGFMSKH